MNGIKKWLQEYQRPQRDADTEIKEDYVGFKDNCTGREKEEKGTRMIGIEN